jgi:thermitase
MPHAARCPTRLITIVVLVFTLCAGSADAGNSAGNAPKAQLLVKFRPNARSAAAASVLANLGAQDVRTLSHLGVRVVRVPASAATHTLAALRQSSAVDYAEKDMTLDPQEVLPDDPYFLDSGAWNLGGGAWGWSVTHTTQAWDVTQGDPSVVIAILDTGIKPSGLDFDGRIASTWNVLNNTTDATSNAGSHGTYVAGVASLAMGNGSGSAGYCPHCSLMVVQVGTDSGASLSNIAAGLTYAADHGARVANLSWAGPSDSTTLQNAINYAHDKGMVIFAAAGNSNCNCVSYPAADKNVLGVAGVSDAAGDKQGDSNYGSWVKIAAPEGNMTAWPSINGAPGYAAVGGTSVAAPAAAGIAGLLFSFNPALTNAQVEQALTSSAAPVKFSVQYGRVDALAALQHLGASDPQTLSAPLQTSAPKIYYELNGWTSITPLTAAPQVGQVLVRGIGGWTGSSGLTVTDLQWQRCGTSGDACMYLTSQPFYTVQAADAGFSIRLAFSVQNSLGAVPVTVLTQPVGGTATAPTAPSNLSPPAISGIAQEGQTLTVSTGAWSGAPTNFAYQWSKCDTLGASCSSISGASSSSYTAVSGDVGSTLRATVTASNTAGSSTAAAAATGTVMQAPSAPPTSAQTLTFSGSLNPKNPTRSFSVTVAAGVAHAALSFSKCTSLNLDVYGGTTVMASKSGPSVVLLDASLAAGTYTYEVGGGRCAFTLTISTG